MKHPLSAEQIYDELNGEEVKTILLNCFRELLDTVPDFQKHLTLPRVRMRLAVNLLIYGRRVPSLDLSKDLTLTTQQPEEEITVSKELEAEEQFNADTGVPVPNTGFDGSGKPPDQIREENGLPLLEPVTTRPGLTQQRPVAPPAVVVEAPNQNPISPSGRPYACFHVIERAGPAFRGAGYVPGHEPIVYRERDDKPDIGVQRDFKEARKG